jgi:aminoglycoside phosphotransferase (APT) family kinase protein
MTKRADQVRPSATESLPRSPSAPETVTAALSVYLDASVRYVRILASGWETTLYEFALSAPSVRLPGVGADVALVLRTYPDAELAGKGALEFRTIEHLARAGFPVPRPYLFEAASGAIGSPFLVIERLAGGPLFAIRSFPQAFKTFSLGFFGFVRAQTRLHRMTSAPADLEGPTAAASDTADRTASAAARLLEKTLDTIAARVEQGPLPGLAAALAQLRRGAGDFRDAPPAFLHLDYHPQNVLVKGMRVTGVIDWAHAALGDRHFDAATTATILSTSSMEHPRWMRANAAGNNLRRTFNSLYLALYHASAPMDLRRLRYYQGVAATLRLSMLEMMRVRGPQSVGFQPGAISQVTPSVLRLLSRYVARKTGTSVAVV